MQQITIAGRIGGDATIKNTSSGDVCNFSVATDQGFGDRKTTNWWRVALWGKRAAALQPYLLKGSDVTVAGEFLSGEYDGKPQLEINANDVKLQGGKREGSGNERTAGNAGESYASNRQAGSGSGAGSADYSRDLDDDVPFLTSHCSYDLGRRFLPVA